MNITKIEVEITQPLNILPDGTMDPKASNWCFGGTSYLIYTTSTGDYPVTLQLEENLWYEPNYQISSYNLIEVIEKVIRLDQELEAENRTHLMDYEDWITYPVDGWESTETMLRCIIAENGMDRELDFDEEKYFEDEYHKYLTT